MKRFFHLGIGGVVLTSDAIVAIAEALDKGGASDWYRQGAYSWFIYSAGDLDKWRDYLRLIPALNTSKASFALLEFDIHAVAGYLLPDAWDWLAKAR